MLCSPTYHAVFINLPCCVHQFTMLCSLTYAVFINLLCCVHQLTMLYSSTYHAVFINLPCCVHQLAMLCSSTYHAVFINLPCCVHQLAMLCSSTYHAINGTSNTRTNRKGCFRLLSLVFIFQSASPDRPTDELVSSLALDTLHVAFTRVAGVIFPQ